MPEDTKPPVDGVESETPEPKVDQMAEVKALINQLKGSIDNVKHEFNRKLDSRLPVPPAPAKKSVQELMYEDPAAAVEEIERSVEDRITRRLETRESNKGLAQKLTSDYPELSDPGNPLTVKANEIFNSFSEAEQKDPRTMRIAVSEAAAEIGIAPKAKRKAAIEQNDDNFSLSSGQGKGSKGRGKKETDLSAETLEVAQLMGLNIDDPKVIASMKKHSQRTFGKYGS